jgi:hypothetical protein
MVGSALARQRFFASLTMTEFLATATVGSTIEYAPLPISPSPNLSFLSHDWTGTICVGGYITHYGSRVRDNSCRVVFATFGRSLRFKTGDRRWIAIKSS